MSYRSDDRNEEDRYFAYISAINNRVKERLIKMYAYTNNKEVLDYINKLENNKFCSYNLCDMIGEGEYLIRKKFGLEPNCKIGVLPFVEKVLRKKFIDRSFYDIVDFCIKHYLNTKYSYDCDIDNYYEILLEIIEGIYEKTLDR